MRHSQRQNDEIRAVEIIPGYNPYAEGSCLIKCGNTHVVCTASVEEKLPAWLKGQNRGWITAEYGMLPRSTQQRMPREAKKGLSGRTQEIQRLIGRSLRAVVDLEKMKDISICIDCDVIQADGGTRTASITGGFVALTLAIRKLMSEKKLKVNPIREHVAAISCAIHNGQEIVDVDYAEDSNAQADMNFVLSESGKIVEIQGTAEGQPFSEEEFNRLFALAKGGIRQLIAKQKEALNLQPKPVIKELVIASHNPGKIAEFTQLLAPFGVKVYSAKDLNLDDVEETGTTFAENAQLKAVAMAKQSGKYALADDSGLCVDALDGAPGVYSARYAPNRDFDKAIDKLLAELAAKNTNNRRAHFECVLALASPEGGECRLFNGRVCGEIALARSGSNGFGFDPVFRPEGDSRSFAEYSAEEKAAVSHRGRALQQFVKSCF